MVRQTIERFVRANPAFKERLRSVLHRFGVETADWLRIVMYQRCFAFIRSLGPERLEVLEISAGPQWVREFEFGKYEASEYPAFDVCEGRLPREFDLIICDQVFEHLKWPYRAGRNVYDMLKPGGHLIISVPFMVRVHEVPIDCNRWTRDGLSYFLQECGFPEAGIRTDAWGNRACVKANLNRWPKRGPFDSMKNEPNFPVMVWAFARKPVDETQAPAGE